MVDFLLNFERDIYTYTYFLAIAFVATWEYLAPRRPGDRSIRQRWPGNIAITIIDIAIVLLVFPVAAVGFSMLIEAQGIGLFNLVDLPGWIAVPVAFILLDLARYTQHYLLHRIPLLWRLHRIHHADHDYDFTVGLRFHPVEALFTTLFMFGAIALAGAPPVAVAVSEIIAVAAAMAVHANGRTPSWLDTHARWIIVTPDMHRIHHSAIEGEHNSNYSALFSLWDRIFATYVEAPAQPHESMEIGLPDLRDTECLTLRWMLLAPFRKSMPATRMPALGRPMRSRSRS